ncbi:MAG: hypothetical protein J2P36_26440, partial [Ktedonobacteraceae bacterium]|nr:hypothetical protein [Ktedonobacteraceae bacterium]
IIIAIEKISPGELGIGARVQCTVRFLGKWLTMTFEIIEYEPNRCLSIKSITGVAPCLFCYQIEPDENSMAILSQEVVIHLTEEMLDLTTSSLTSVVRCQLAYDLRTLKDVLESRPFPV